MFVRWMLSCLLPFFIAGSARADAFVECTDDRAGCTAEMESMCPGRVQVTDEQERVSTPSARNPAHKHFRVWFRCAPEGNAQSASAVATPADANGTDMRDGAAADPAPVPPQAAPDWPEGSAFPPPPAAVPAPTVSARPTRPISLDVELGRVEERLASLTQERRRHSLAGPIVLTAIGFGGAAYGLLVGSFLYSLADSNGDDDDPAAKSREDEQRGTATALLAVGGVGLGLGIVGTVWIAKTRRERATYVPEIRALKERRNMLLRQLRYGVLTAPGAGGLTLAGNF